MHLLIPFFCQTACSISLLASFMLWPIVAHSQVIFDGAGDLAIPHVPETTRGANEGFVHKVQVVHIRERTCRKQHNPQWYTLPYRLTRR